MGRARIRRVTHDIIIPLILRQIPRWLNHTGRAVNHHGATNVNATDRPPLPRCLISCEPRTGAGGSSSSFSSTVPLGPRLKNHSSLISLAFFPSVRLTFSIYTERWADTKTFVVGIRGNTRRKIYCTRNCVETVWKREWGRRGGQVRRDANIFCFGFEVIFIFLTFLERCVPFLRKILT